MKSERESRRGREKISGEAVFMMMEVESSENIYLSRQEKVQSKPMMSGHYPIFYRPIFLIVVLQYMITSLDCTTWALIDWL